MFWNTILLALRSIRRNMLRSFLTILGIVIGVSAVITMVALGNGATRAVQQQIANLGTNLLQIRTGQRMGPGWAAPSFKVSDVTAIAQQIGGISAVAPEARSSATAVANGRNWTTSLFGSTNDWLVAANWQLAQGRAFTGHELQAGAAVCIIGDTLRRELFGADASVVGQAVRLKNFSCEVVGLFASKGQGGMGDQDDLILLPLSTLQRRVTGSRRLSTILVSVEEGSDSERVQNSLTQLLRELRKLGPGEDNNFNILDTKQLANTMTDTTRVLTTLLGAVAGVSLLVGGIGIMNIMLVSVTERTREIGLRLAIGALEREVLLQFLIEAVVLAMLGGLLGIALATVVSIALAALMGLPYVFSPMINVLSFVFSAMIGIIFGYFPARRAARLDPIEALRHE